MTLLTKEKQSDRHRKQTHSCQRRKEGRGELGVGVTRHTQHIQHRQQRPAMSTRHYIQYLGITIPEKMWERIFIYLFIHGTSSGGSDRKEPAYNAQDSSSVPGSGRSAGEGNSYPLQYSCLGEHRRTRPAS